MLQTNINIRQIDFAFIQTINEEAANASAKENAKMIMGQLFHLTDFSTFSALLALFREYDDGEIKPGEIELWYKQYQDDLKQKCLPYD